MCPSTINIIAMASYLILNISGEVHHSNHNYDNLHGPFQNYDSLHGPFQNGKNKQLKFEIYKAEVMTLRLEHLKKFLKLIDSTIKLPENFTYTSSSHIKKPYPTRNTFFENNIVGIVPSQYFLPHLNISFNHTKISSLDSEIPLDSENSISQKKAPDNILIREYTDNYSKIGKSDKSKISNNLDTLSSPTFRHSNHKFYGLPEPSGRVFIHVFRCPIREYVKDYGNYIKDHKYFAPWGYYVKQPVYK